MIEARWIEGDSFGGPDVLKLRSGEVSAPGAGEVLLRQHAIGVNFIDVLQRRGELGLATPYRLGLEGTGEVIAVGASVGELRVGDRIVYAGGPTGAYADVRLVPACRCVRLPAQVSYADAAAIFFKALTADYLVNRLWPLSKGDTVLFTAAAGGVGSIAIPLLKQAGIQVIGTVGSTEKAAFAAQLGCDHVIVLNEDESLSDQVRALTDGHGVAVAYDSIGQKTFDQSLNSVQRFGLLVSYGWASGDVPGVSLAKMREQGSIFVTRPTVSHYTEARDDLVAGAARVFTAMGCGIIRPSIFAEYRLDEAAIAHERLESGTSSGSIVLHPGQLTPQASAR